jgi:hypothetical protein
MFMKTKQLASCIWLSLMMRRRAQIKVAKVSLVKGDGASAASGAGGAAVLAQEAWQAQAAQLNKVGSNWARAGALL